MPKSPVEIIAEYETGKYQGCELDISVEIHHNEDTTDDGNAPDWRVDNIIRLSGDQAWKVLEFIKTIS